MVDFGTDTSCTDSIRTGRFSSGLRLVAEAIYRRFITPRGTLVGGEDEANYGLDLADEIGSAVSPALVAALGGKIENEALKDQRVDTAVATVTSTQNGPSVSWEIAIACTTGAGPFSLVIGVEGVTVSLLGISTG